ncbi:hypothetical protein PI125_g24592 [Phytophthora idaei]|nr:hypothetical protein PI125_g24592 [Phytophthora idaei]
MKRLPFSFVERKLARLNASLSSISEETGVRCLVIVAAKAEVRPACALPDNFGLVLDGWSDGVATLLLHSRFSTMERRLLHRRRMPTTVISTVLAVLCPLGLLSTGQRGGA